jgi:hypothetical protein
MHDPVPVAARGGVDVLTEAVRLVEKIVIQPERGLTCRGHIGVVDAVEGEGLLN